MFVKNASLDLSRLSRSYSFHFYGSLSATLRVRPNDRSVYDYLAWSHCALTYDYVVNVLGQFEWRIQFDTQQQQQQQQHEQQKRMIQIKKLNFVCWIPCYMYKYAFVSSGYVLLIKKRNK